MWHGGIFKSRNSRDRVLPPVLLSEIASWVADCGDEECCDKANFGRADGYFPWWNHPALRSETGEPVVVCLGAGASVLLSWCWYRLREGVVSKIMGGKYRDDARGKGGGALWTFSNDMFSRIIGEFWKIKK